ncbi:hypothetical protein JCM8097_006424 [Rhodosporidiobolus ruineniae]
MPGPGAASVDASTRLLRVLTSLTAQLDPVKGIDAKTARRTAEDVDDIVEDYGTSLSSDICQLLTSASSSLSALSTSIVPYSACLSAHLSLARALSLFADSPPTRPSPFSRLPTELVDRIVELCQGGDDDGDMRLRQKTNLALASTCRAFHRSAQPILRREVHLFTLGLLCDLSIQELKLRNDGSWPGRHVETVLPELSKLEVLHVHFRPSMPFTQYRNGSEDQVFQALGLEEDMWNYLFDKPTLRDLRMPLFAQHQLSDYAFNKVPFNPPPHLTRLAIGHRDYPLDLDLWVPHLVQLPGYPRGHNYTHLSLPWLPIQPSDLLELIRPAPDLVSNLVHLEVLLMFYDDAAAAVDDLEELFAYLAPSLRSLTIRADKDREDDWTPDERDEVTDGLCMALSQCKLLEHLEIAASTPCLSTDFSVNLSRAHPPNVRSIVFLSPHALHGLVDYAENRPRSVRSAKICLPSPDDWLALERGDMAVTRGALVVAAEHGLELELWIRLAEAAWWARRNS